MKNIFLCLFSLAVISCATVSSLQPTSTAVPPRIPTRTKAPTPTLEPYQSDLPQQPEGYEWKIVENLKIAVLIPDGWFYKVEDRKDLGLEGFYVTRENIDEVGRFSVGMTVYVFHDISDPKTEANRLLDLHRKLDTTKEILGSWEYSQGGVTSYQLRILGEYPKETEENRRKIIQYFTYMLEDRPDDIYFVIFESPEKEWESMFEGVGVNILGMVFLDE